MFGNQNGGMKKLAKRGLAAALLLIGATVAVADDARSSGIVAGSPASLTDDGVVIIRSLTDDGVIIIRSLTDDGVIIIRSLTDDGVVIIRN